MPAGNNGGVARALAIDAGDAASPYGNVWVGLYSHRQFIGFQGTDGAVLERDGLENPVAVGHSPYGAVVDSNGYVWSGTLSGNSIVGFDSRTGRAGGVVRGVLRRAVPAARRRGALLLVPEQHEGGAAGEHRD